MSKMECIVFFTFGTYWKALTFKVVKCCPWVIQTKSALLWLNEIIQEGGAAILSNTSPL